MPTRVTVTAGNDSEKDQLRAMLRSDRLYVIDRGYAEYQLFQEILDAKSGFWLKCILGCRHLLSTCPNGVRIQVYLAIIASLLVSLWTGCKPTKRTFEMICHYFNGWASLDELLAHIEKLKKHSDSDTVTSRCVTRGAGGLRAA